MKVARVTVAASAPFRKRFLALARRKQGASFKEFVQAAPELTRHQIRKIATDMCDADLVWVKGIRPQTTYHRVARAPRIR